MDIFWVLFEILVTVFESFVAVRFMFSFQKFNFSPTVSRLRYVCSSLAYAALVTAVTYFIPYGLAEGVMYIAYLFIISLLFVESKPITKLFASTITVLVSIAVSSAVIGALSITFKESLDIIMSEMSWVRFAGVVVVQLLKLFVYDVILKATNSTKIKFGKNEWLLVLSVFGISFVAIAFIQTASVEMNEYSPLLLIAILCLIALIVVCFYMTLQLSKRKYESEQLKLNAQQNIFRHQYAENVKKQCEEIRRLRHDMKQINQTVMSLLINSETDKALELLKENAKNISSFDVVIDIGDVYINAIINAKLSEAKRKGITVICSADKNIPIVNEVDICNLIGNLLDNAIEACEKCDNKLKMIELNLKQKENKFLIVVGNTAPENSLGNNRQLITTKENAELHGYGIKTITEIAKKHNGMVDFSQNGERFRTTVVLSYN